MTRYEEIALALLGRIAFPPEALRLVVVRGKKDPNAYLRGYNALNGTRTVRDVAAIVGVTPGTIVPILQQWERVGIIFEVETGEKGKFYRNLYQLED